MKHKYPICPVCQAYMELKTPYLKCPSCAYTIKKSVTWRCSETCDHALNEACYETVYKRDVKRERDS